MTNITNENKSDILEATTPISAMGPDHYRGTIVFDSTHCALMVRRDQNQPGWSLSELPGLQATITVGNNSMTATPTWSNLVFQNLVYGLVDISSIFDPSADIQVSYDYNNETYTETFSKPNFLPNP